VSPRRTPTSPAVTLRDFFAAEALAAIVTSARPGSSADYAALAYELADAALAARTKGPTTADVLAAAGAMKLEQVDGADPLAAFSDFAAEVRKRLDAGRVAYGDRSFAADPAELVRQIEEELLDVCGWSFVLVVRLRRLRAAAEQLEGRTP